jgi:hypothetical protein
MADAPVRFRSVALTNSNLLEQQTASEKATAKRKAKGEIFSSSGEIISGIASTPKFDGLDRTSQLPEALRPVGITRRARRRRILARHAQNRHGGTATGAQAKAVEAIHGC